MRKCGEVERSWHTRCCFWPSRRGTGAATARNKNPHRGSFVQFRWCHTVRKSTATTARCRPRPSRRVASTYFPRSLLRCAIRAFRLVHGAALDGQDDVPFGLSANGNYPCPVNNPVTAGATDGRAGDFAAFGMRTARGQYPWRADAPAGRRPWQAIGKGRARIGSCCRCRN